MPDATRRPTTESVELESRFATRLRVLAAAADLSVNDWLQQQLKPVIEADLPGVVRRLTAVATRGSEQRWQARVLAAAHGVDAFSYRLFQCGERHQDDGRKARRFRRLLGTLLLELADPAKEG